MTLDNKNKTSKQKGGCYTQLVHIVENNEGVCDAAICLFLFCANKAP